MKKYVKAAVTSLLDEDISVQEELARGTDTEPKVLRELSESPNTWVRYFVAENNNAPIDILDKLSKDSESVVRASVATNSSVTVDILDRLAHDSDILVRDAAVKNPQATEDILENYQNDIESIKSRVTGIVREAITNAIDDMISDLYDLVPEHEPRYNEDWWEADTDFEFDEDALAEQIVNNIVLGRLPG